MPRNSPATLEVSVALPADVPAILDLIGRAYPGFGITARARCSAGSTLSADRRFGLCRIDLKRGLQGKAPDSRPMGSRAPGGG
jgi:hypothetical protein